MGRRLSDFEQGRVRQWLAQLRGSMPMETLAADMSASRPGWDIDRTRYGKYESGAIGIGPKVFGELLAYWESKGAAGPDFTPDPEPVPETPTLEASLMRLAEEIAANREERVGLRRERDQMRDQVAALNRTVAALVARIAALEAAVSPMPRALPDSAGSGQ